MKSMMKIIALAVVTTYTCGMGVSYANTTTGGNTGCQSSSCKNTTATDVEKNKMINKTHPSTLGSTKTSPTKSF